MSLMGAPTGRAETPDGFLTPTIMKTIMVAGRAAIRGHEGIRALLPELANVWQWVDVLPTNKDFEEWRAA